MWFERMSLEDWFDTWQYHTRFDVGESAVKFRKLSELGIDLGEIELRYGHHAGRPDVRALVALEYEGFAAEDVIVTAGGAEAIFSIAAALLRPGDHVIVEHPNYPSTYEVPRGLGAEVSLLTLRFEDEFKPDLERLEALIRPNTKLIVFTHPNNPTGSMMTRRDLDALLRVVESRDLYLLFDETYRHMTFGETLPAAASLSQKAISVSSMSKVYGLPGIRIGWLATRSRVVRDAVLAIREQVTITNTALSEAIAAHVLGQRDIHLEHARRHVARNRDIVFEWMATQPRLEWVPPEGGVVGFPRLLDVASDGEAEDLYRTLAREQQVFIVPGRCFEMESRHFRLGFGGTSDELQAGLSRIGKVLTLSESLS